MPQIDAPRTSSVATATRSTEEGSSAEYRVTFGCSLDEPQDPRAAREPAVRVDD